MPLSVSGNIEIPDEELEWKFIRSSGPGGQNVNKVASAVQLRFLLARNTSLPPAARHRLRRLAGQRLTDEGDVLITARAERSQEQNRRDALQRLGALIGAAMIEPKARKKTRPTRASKERRIESKKRRGGPSASAAGAPGTEARGAKRVRRSLTERHLQNVVTKLLGEHELSVRCDAEQRLAETQAPILGGRDDVAQDEKVDEVAEQALVEEFW
jgi:ribosome-associated protein